MLFGACFVFLSVTNLICPGRSLEWVGGKRCTQPLEKLLLRIWCAWGLLEGLYLMGVPIDHWLPQLQHILIG